MSAEPDPAFPAPDPGADGGGVGLVLGGLGSLVSSGRGGVGVRGGTESVGPVGTSRGAELQSKNSKVYRQKEKSKCNQAYKVYVGERGILLLGDWALAALHYGLGALLLLRGTSSAGCPSSSRCSRWALPSLSLVRSHGGGIHLLHLVVRVS